MSKLSKIIFTLLALWAVTSFISSFTTLDLHDKIAVIPLEGAITGSDSAGFLSTSALNSQTIVSFLQQANKDDSVKGILLVINSPGGTVVASKEIVEAVKNSNKPVVAYIREIGTSGAYWIASAADHIVADELSLTGSIGVVSGFLEFSGLLEEYGVTYEGLKTGKYKDIGSPYRQMTDEERTLLLGKMQKIHEYFVADVAANRELDKDQVAALANGIYYLGSEAVDLGLIDEVGSKELALNRTKELTGISEATAVEYKQRHYLGDFFNKLSAFSFYNIGLGIGKSLQTVNLEEQQRPFLV